MRPGMYNVPSSVHARKNKKEESREWWGAESYSSGSPSSRLGEIFWQVVIAILWGIMGGFLGFALGAIVEKFVNCNGIVTNGATILFVLVFGILAYRDM